MFLPCCWNRGSYFRKLIRITACDNLKIRKFESVKLILFDILFVVCLILTLNNRNDDVMRNMIDNDWSLTDNYLNRNKTCYATFNQAEDLCYQQQSSDLCKNKVKATTMSETTFICTFPRLMCQCI